MEESTDPKQASSTTTTTYTSNYPPKSTTMTTVAPSTKQSIGDISSTTTNNTNNNTARFKVDSLFTNVTNVGNKVITETREIHQETRDKPQEHALIRMEKYERV